MTDRGSALRSLVAGLAVSGMTLLIALIAAEIVLRLFAPVPVEAATGEPIARHVEVRQTIPGVKPLIVYEQNGYGLRSQSMYTHGKPDGTLRVLCIGASTTDQAVQETADTWCGQLETRLKADYSDRQINIETASFGRGGLTTAQLAEWARRELRGFEPDVVVVLMGVNDLTWRGEPDKELLRERPAQPAAQRKLSLAGRCAHTFQLCQRAAIVKQRVQMAIGRSTGRLLEWHSANLPRLREAYRSYPLVQNPERSPADLQSFERAMDEVVQAIQAAGANAVLLGQPTLWKADLSPEERAVLWFPVRHGGDYVRADPGWLQQEMHKYNESVRAVARRDHAAYLDLEPLIPKRLDMFFDDCHFTDEGNRVLAEAILPTVERELDRRLNATASSGNEPQHR